jgi:hypothetical protein
MSIAPAPRILVVAGLCAAALIGLVVNEGAARSSGQEALIAMEAVDPRSLLSGHYVMINMTQRLEPTETCPEIGADWEWVAFQRSEGAVLDFAGGAASREGALQVAPIPVKGTVICSSPTEGMNGAEGLPGWVQLDLGIDRFHINQTDALRIERVLGEQRPGEAVRAYAIVSIGRDGAARLKGLMIDGERLELSWL